MPGQDLIDKARRVFCLRGWRAEKGADKKGLRQVTSQDMLHSLGLMVHLKKVSGVTKVDCQGIVDYHDFLADVEQQAAGSAAVAGFNAAHPFVELADITLTQLQYSDAVEQMYDGDIHYMSLPSHSGFRFFLPLLKGRDAI